MTTTRSEEMMQLMLALRRHRVTDPRVLSAFEQTPRELFVENTFDGQAYADRALPISCGQTISQPSVVAMMTQALDVTPRRKVLEVGAGSVYQVARVATLERLVYGHRR